VGRDKGAGDLYLYLMESTFIVVVTGTVNSESVAFFPEGDCACAGWSDIYMGCHSAWEVVAIVTLLSSGWIYA